MFTVESDVPLVDRRGANSKYPWAKMNIGDSFYAEVDHRTLRACARWQHERHGTAFKVRTEGKGSRAFRIA